MEKLGLLPGVGTVAGGVLRAGIIVTGAANNGNNIVQVIASILLYRARG